MNARLNIVIDELRARHGDLPAAHAGISDDMLTTADLAADLGRLESWLDVQGIDAVGMDRKTCAAYMIGGLAYAVCSWMAALELSGQPFAIRRAGFAQERYWYRFADGTQREYVRYPVCLEVSDGAANHRATIEQMFEPIIAALMVTSGLSAGAQWRLVADNVASAFLSVGKALGVADQGMAIARGIIAEGRLDNGKTGFIEVHAGDASEHFLVRGGCCRYYTTSDGQGEYCTSCVLRPRDDQLDRYSRYLAQTRAAG